MSAIERKQKMKSDFAPVTVNTPNGTDGKKYRNFNPKDSLQKILINFSTNFYKMCSFTRCQSHAIRREWLFL